MKKITRTVCLLLAVCMLLLTATACNDSGKKNIESGERGEDGSWDEVDFGGEKLIVSISTAQDPQGTFPAADIYTKGPDNTNTTDKVQTKVLARNEKVAKTLNIDVVYKEEDLTYDKVADRVSTLVNNDDENTPDVFNNDIYGLLRAMIKGQLYNVLNPVDGKGNQLQNYFDFSYDGWYKDYMRGATMDASKQYLVAGDYFIDLVRFAWVIYVNIDKYDATFATYDTPMPTYTHLARRIYDNWEWSYDDLMELSAKGWKDTTQRGVTNKEDDVIGFFINNVGDRVFTYTSGISFLSWESGTQGIGTPYVVGTQKGGMEGQNALTKLAEKYKELYNKEGVLFINDVLPTVTMFMDQKSIFTMAKLGEMESVQLRGTDFNRGLVVYPKADANSDGPFHTMVHDQAEIGAILSSSRRFTMASAYLEMLNEESTDVLNEYNNSLKFKYNDNDAEQAKAVRDMIETVHDTIDTPFEPLLGGYICTLTTTQSTIYTLIQTQAKGGLNNNSFTSNYTAYVDALQVATDELMDIFRKLP
ncbi:MAG: hypothetical protein MJ078_00305 [Clostridia bacterium]|nr:hypothetical protein [Clostridia bacterium]